MKKNATVLLLILLSSFSALAKEFAVTFTPDTLLRQRSAYNKVILFDLREKKDNIGSLAGGVKRAPLVTAYPLDSMMSNFGTRLIGKAAKQENNTLFISLKDFIVEEKTNGEFAIGNIYFNADFYLEQSGRYTKVCTMDSLFEFRIMSPQADYLTKVSNRILSGLMTSIAVITVPQGQTSFSLEEVKDMDKLARSRYPVYSQEHKQGIYYTFGQFLSNTPGDTAFTHKHNVGGDMVSDKFYKKQEGRNKGTDLADTTCYAVYSSGKWYIPQGKRVIFKEMLFRNGDFFYTQKGEGLVQVSAATYGYFGGGVLGYLAANAVAESANNKNPNKQGKAVFRYKLNPETGGGIKVERLE